MDKKTREQKNIISKKKIRSIDVHVPLASLDYRVSLNLEMKVDFPKDCAQDSFERHKDRLCYLHNLVSVDLTQVTEWDRDKNQEVKVLHELELEIRDPDSTILKEKKLRDQGLPNQLLLNIQHLAQNTRTLINRAR